MDFLKKLYNTMIYRPKTNEKEKLISNKKNKYKHFEYLKIVIYNKNKDVIYIKDFSRKNEAFELFNIYNKETGLIEKTIVKNYTLEVYHPGDERDIDIVGYAFKSLNDPIDSKVVSKYLTEYIYNDKNEFIKTKTKLVQILQESVFEDYNKLSLNKIEELNTPELIKEYSKNENLPYLISFEENGIEYDKYCNSLIIDDLNLENNYILEFDLKDSSFKYIKDYFKNKDMINFVDNFYYSYSSLDPYNN